ncbi:MAG: hypothetical protein VR72_06850 [Clostridiaceae bacterium BRH_c20a]|nr:MAG: hypothetical protein VR72_06850 [Clostridiaceae bacterium BRH_c20a]
MNFTHLRSFYYVGKYLSFSEAAKNLYISQPTVSIQVRRLEEELQVKLIEQLGKKVYLTDAGKRLYSYATEIFKLAKEANLMINDISDFNIGQVLLGAGTTAGIYLLPELLGSFKADYPKVEIKLQIGNSKHITQRLLDNEIDFAVIGEGLDLDLDLRSQSITKDELVLIVSPNHPLAIKTEVSILDLCNETFILRERGSSSREIFENSIIKNNVKINVAMEFNCVEAIKKAVSANLGVSVVSNSSFKLEKQQNVIASLKIKDLDLVRNIYLVYHKDKEFANVIKNCIKYISLGIDIK